MQQRITRDAFINVDDDEGLQKQEATVSLDQLMENEFKVTHHTYNTPFLIPLLSNMT